MFHGVGLYCLPTAIIAAKHGVEIAGVDINAQVVEVSNPGEIAYHRAGYGGDVGGRYWPPDISRRTPSLR